MVRAPRLHTAFDVSTNRWLLHRYAYLEERLLATLAGWIWSTPALPLKVVLGEHAYLDARHADALRRRVEELAPSTEAPPRAPDLLPLETFANEVANAPTLPLRLVGVYRVVKPLLLQAYQVHLARTDDLTDGPTVWLLRQLVAEEAAQIAWGEATLATLPQTEADRGEAAAWEAHLRGAWQTIGGVHDHPTGTPSWRNPHPPERFVGEPPARDGRWLVVPPEEYFVPSMGETPNEIVRHLLYANAHGEVEAEELLGRVLADAPELPWAMRLDLARQMWDEARHAEMSWRRLEELGGVPDPKPPITTVVLTPMEGLTDPLERLLVLQRVVEGRATERHRYRVIYLARELGDPQTARLFEYIVADERAHIGYSQWIQHLVGDDPERVARLEEVHKAAEQRFEALISRRADATAGMSAGGKAS
ncbi:MAG TPA: ferritin-like domain-containing protein, partial [Chloroflexota bacterium]